jgi:TonB family protein
MKRFLPVLFLGFSIILNGQKYYLDEYKASLVDSSKAKFYEIIDKVNNKSFKKTTFYLTGEKESEFNFVKSQAGKGISYLWYLGAPGITFEREGDFRSWYKNGQLKSQTSDNNGIGNTKNNSWYESGKMESEENFISGKQEGKSYKWFENGQLKSECNYLNGQYNGEIITYWQNGLIKRKDQYLKGKFENGFCYDSLGNEIKHFELEVMPKYSGGDKQLLKDVSNKLEYPINSRDAGIQGRVIIRFAVDKIGDLTDLEVMAGINEELNLEAIRVIRTIKKFEPGRYDGEIVKVYYMIPVVFNLQ